MTMDYPDRLLTVEEAAERLGVPVETVVYACRHGLAPFHFTGDGPKFRSTHARLDPQDFRRWVFPDGLGAAVARHRALPVVELIRQQLPEVQDDRFVYFIGADKAVKIGSAVDPAARLAELQCGNHVRLALLGTVPGGHPLERALHKHLAKYRTHGEWFRATKVVRRFIAETVSTRYG